MAEIVLGLGSSHAPQLALTPAGWWRRADGDRMDTEEFWFRGRAHTFNELAEVRAPEHLEAQIDPDLAERRYQTCQQAIHTLAETLSRVAPDVCIIVGDDQAECFLDDNMPAVSVYWGDTVDVASIGERGPSGVPGRGEAGAMYGSQSRMIHPGQPDLGRHLIESMVADGIDLAHSRRLPQGRHAKHAIGHAFTFVYHRLMHDEVGPHVPMFLNTYFPPNQPTMARCFTMGRALRRAIESWDSEKRVALIASGGWTHKVIEEDLDALVLESLREKKEELITSLPMNRFMSGTSEIRNWAVVGAAMGDAEMKLVDYVPCYRSSAGTGCAMAFAEWQ
jgi:hypothetical protein